MRSRRSCCVVGCQNSELKNPELYFYCFPGQKWEIERRKVWINAVKRTINGKKLWQPSKNSRICSAHFVGGKKSGDPANPTFNPTIFPSQYKKKAIKMERYERLKQRREFKDASQRQEVPIDDFDVSDIGASFNSICVQTDFCYDEKDDEKPSVLFCSLSGLDASTQTNISVERKAKKNTNVTQFVTKPKLVTTGCGPDAELPKGFMGYMDIKDDSVMKQLGGVSLLFFTVLLGYIKPGTYMQPNYFKKICKENRLLLFLMKMKLGLSMCALGCLFGIHRTTASRIFFEVLQTLAHETKYWIFWPSKAAIKKSLPTSFHNYPNCRAIIDCTEVKCDTPPTVEQRVLMYSNYKGCFTLKYLIAISPNGFISFVSKAYGGRATDGFITNDSGFLNLIDPGDMIMADKGFPQIKTGLLGKNATLVIPPFCHNPQFTEEEVNEGYNIASVRIHVERAIQRTKIYSILNHINVELFPYVDAIMHLCCVLANNQPPVVKIE